MKYIMLITYSWDSDYIAVPCNDDIEAMEWLNRYLDEEVKTIREENEYEPTIIRHNDELVELMYDEELAIDSNTDVATYRVIEISNGFNKRYWDTKSK